MKILQLCIRVPYPPADGGSIAMYNIARSLVENNAEVKIIAFNTIKQFVDTDKLPAEYLQQTKLETVFLDNRVKPLPAFFNLFGSDSYNIIRFIKRDFDEMLIRTLQNNSFDIIQLESLFMIPYVDTIRNYCDAKIVLRTHNIEHLIWERLAAQESRPLKKWYLKLLTKRLLQFEYSAFKRTDAVIAMTSEDAKLIHQVSAGTPVHIAPAGIDLADYKTGIDAEPETVFHIGAMDWLPNQDGIKWFLDEVWPLVKSHHPTVKLVLAGKQMPAGFFKYSDARCKIMGQVEDAKEFMSKGSVMIVPVHSGSGMRVKIVEAMAMSKAIVSTTIGIEGIPAEHERNILIADSREDFAAAIVNLISNPRYAQKIGTEAYKLSESCFQNAVIGKKLVEFYQSLKH